MVSTDSAVRTGRIPGQIPFSRIDSLGLVYITRGTGDDKVVFVPFKQVAGAVF